MRSLLSRSVACAALLLATGSAQARLAYMFDPAAVRPPAAGASVRCPADVVPMTDMDGLDRFYRPGADQSRIDPEARARFDARTERLNRWKAALRVAGGAWGGKMRREASGCLARHLLGWARAGALRTEPVAARTQQQRMAVMVVVWATPAIATAYQLAAAGNGLSSSEQAELQRWIRTLALPIRREFDRPPGGRPAWMDRTSNHSLWAGLSLSLLAVCTGDRDDFTFGMQALRRGLAAVDAHGGWPVELARGRRAVHYQGFAMAPTAMLVALADRNGVGLTAAEEAALVRAARFTLALSRDPGLLGPSAPEQDMSQAGPAWAAALLAPMRRRDPALAADLAATLAAMPPIVSDFSGMNVSQMFAVDAGPRRRSAGRSPP